MRFPIESILFPGWQTYADGNFTHGTYKQDGHFNVVGGATGMSWGEVEFNLLTGSLEFERSLGNRALAGFEVGACIGKSDYSGSFNGGGTVPVLRLGGFVAARLTDNIYGGPCASVIFPPGNATGTTGEITIDALVLFGITLQLGRQPDRR